ncbi:Sec1-like protein, partial [Kipferlia bialata]
FIKEVLQGVPSKEGVPEGWKILLVDDVTLQIVTSLMKASELMRYKISLVENVKNARRPYRKFEAIYFVTPTLESLTHMARDFSFFPAHDDQPMSPIPSPEEAKALMKGGCCKPKVHPYKYKRCTLYSSA